MKSLRQLALCGLLAVSAPLGGCSTVAGTAVSPITGGVDLCVEALRPGQWYYAPFVFVGGAVAGPFVAFYNGVNYDASALNVSLHAYWAGFSKVFRPWGMVL